MIFIPKEEYWDRDKTCGWNTLHDFYTKIWLFFVSYKDKNLMCQYQQQKDTQKYNTEYSEI